MARGYYMIFIISANHKSHRTTFDWCVSTPTISDNTAVMPATDEGEINSKWGAACKSSEYKADTM